MPSQSITSKASFPATAHYAILEFASVHHEGDERSRTNPGHGYPAYSEDVCHYIAFTDQTEWLAEVQKRAERDLKSYQRDDWVAFEVSKPVNVMIGQ